MIPTSALTLFFIIFIFLAFKKDVSTTLSSAVFYRALSSMGDERALLHTIFILMKKNGFRDLFSLFFFIFIFFQ